MIVFVSPALKGMLAYIRSDDEAVVYSIDRLALNLRDLETSSKRSTPRVLVSRSYPKNTPFLVLMMPCPR